MHINSWADRQSSRGGSESDATLSTSFCKKRCMMPGIDRDVCCCETQAATSLCISIAHVAYFFLVEHALLHVDERPAQVDLEHLTA